MQDQSLTPNVSVESYIRYFTDDYTLRWVPIAHIYHTTLGSQSRTRLDKGGIIQSNLDQMFCSLLDGAVLPPIVVRETENGRFETLDGNHRVNVGRELEWENIVAYVVHVDDVTARRMIIRANRNNGRDVGSDKDRLTQALEEVRLGTPVHEAAKVWAISANKLSTQARVQKGRERAAKAGVKAAAKLTDAHYEVIHDMDTDVLRALNLNANRVTSDELKSAKKAVAAEDSHSEQMAVADSWGRTTFSEMAKGRKGPGGNAKPFTVTKARSLAKELRDGLRQNRAVAKNQGVRELLNDIVALLADEAQDAAA